jgi:cell division protein FtsW
MESEAVYCAEVTRIPRGRIDVPLLVVVSALVSLGVVMIYSSSSIIALSRYGDSNYFLNRQIMGLGLGLVALIVGMRVDYRWYRRLVYWFLGGTLLLLAAVYIPGIGVSANDARRWLLVAGVRFQPGELAKIVTVMYLAYSVTKKRDGMKSFSLAFIPHLAVIGAMVVLLLPQPDFGTSVVLIVTMGFMVFLGGAPVAYLVGFVSAAAVFAYYAVISSAYRLARIEAFLDPEAFRQGAGWQVTESFLALGSGGIGGLGLGEGHLKLGYVPELWNDFIGTIIGHELGLIGVASVLVLFLIFFWRGVHISIRATDAFGSYLAFGLTALLSLQAGINLGVMTGLLPNKGMTLPFVSFGRSSILVCLFTVGILLNISQRNPDLFEDRQAEKDEQKQERVLSKRKARLLADRLRVTS